MDNSVLYLSSIPESIVYTCPPLKHPDAALPLMSKVCQCWSAQNAGMLIFNTVENIELCMVILVLFGTHLLHWFAHLLHIGLLLFSSNCPPTPPRPPAWPGSSCALPVWPLVRRASGARGACEGLFPATDLSPAARSPRSKPQTRATSLPARNCLVFPHRGETRCADGNLLLAFECFYA